MPFILFLILLCSCGRETDVAAPFLTSEALLASVDVLPLTNTQFFTEEDQKRLHKEYPKTWEKLSNLKSLSIQDIKNMTRAGVTDETIIASIQKTCSLFFLTPDDEQELKQSGISQKTILAMKETGSDHY